MIPFTPEFIKVAVLRADGGVSIKSIITLGRGRTLEHGAVWMDEAAGIWARSPTDEVVRREVEREFPPGTPWHRITDDSLQHDRDYRDAVVHVPGEGLKHDLPRARELKRMHIRHERARALPELDAQWNRATGQGKKKDASEIEAQRQKWRDAPADPRIEAAQTVDDLRPLWGTAP